MLELNRELVDRAEQAGVKLEIVDGLPMWEGFPVVRHQREVFRIQQTIRRIAASVQSAADDSPCGCFHYSDIYVRFGDGSLKRPDIAIFGTEDIEQDDVVTALPEAVIEVISPGFEAKDLDIGARFYRAHGVKDVIVFDPRTLIVLHLGRAGAERLISPVNLALQCGCQVTV